METANGRLARGRALWTQRLRPTSFDTGVLIGLERRHASALALLKACKLSRATITIPASVVAEWWRGSHRAVLESGVVEALTSEPSAPRLYGRRNPFRRATYGIQPGMAAACSSHFTSCASSSTSSSRMSK